MINSWEDIYWAEITEEERERLTEEALEDAAAWAEVQREDPCEVDSD